MDLLFSVGLIRAFPFARGIIPMKYFFSGTPLIEWTVTSNARAIAFISHRLHTASLRLALRVRRNYTRRAKHFSDSRPCSSCKNVNIYLAAEHPTTQARKVMDWSIRLQCHFRSRVFFVFASEKNITRRGYTVSGARKMKKRKHSTSRIDSQTPLPPLILKLLLRNSFSRRE